MAKENAVRQHLETALQGLPMQKMSQVADFAEYLKSWEEWEATMEFLNDPVMRNEIEEGRIQALQGKGRSWREMLCEFWDFEFYHSAARKLNERLNVSIHSSIGT